MQSSRLRLLLAPALVAALVAGWPVTSVAQRARHRVVVGAGFGYPYYFPPFYPLYHPYWHWYGWGPYPYYYPLVNYGVSSLRVAVKPSDAQVFVDGYLAGEVDRYDNVFQRLTVSPGGHEITLYHEQYRTFRQEMYFAPGGDQKLELRMEPLAPGETPEAPPAPSPPQSVPATAGVGEPAVEAEARPHARRVREGTLSMRVVPGDAEILIGDKTWTAPAGQERLTISLAEGRYTLEVRKAGYQPYVQDILIRRNATLRLTVTLHQ